MTHASTTARRVVAGGLVCLGIAAATYGALRLTLGPVPVFIHVRWAPEVDDFGRRVAERRYRLSSGEQLEGRTWGYTLNDVSAANIKALVSDASVEDTQDIDRTAFHVTSSAERRPYPASDSLVPVSLWGATVLFLVIGLSATSVGLMQRASADTAIVAHPEQSDISRRLTGKQWLALLVVVVALGGCFLWSRTMDLRVDEENHLAQIDRYASGDLATATGTVGGFHAAAAAVKWATGLSRKEGIRLLVLLISGATILVFFALARSFYPHAAVVRTLQFVFFPLLFPFWFLIYTDVYALMFLLLAVLALTSDRFHAAGILMILSVTARQTYAVWMALLGLWTGIVNAGAPLPRLIKRSISFAAGAALFLLFVMVNDGVAVADRSSHPDMELQTENLLFMLVCFSLMFLPLVVARIPQIARLHPALLIVVPLASVVLFFGTFQVDHPWNAKWQELFLRNAMLDTMTSSTTAGLVTCAAIALAILSLCVIQLRQPAHHLIYPFAALSVMPVWLIEQRYYIPAFALFMLFRESATPWVERTLLAVNVIMSAWLFEGIVNGRFFL
jgi:alpha-1,2-glucosyltransferase